jgi:hypothetical protein
LNIQIRIIQSRYRFLGLLLREEELREEELLDELDDRGAALLLREEPDDLGATLLLRDELEGRE